MTIWVAPEVNLKRNFQSSRQKPSDVIMAQSVVAQFAQDANWNLSYTLKAASPIGLEAWGLMFDMDLQGHYAHVSSGLIWRFI